MLYQPCSYSTQRNMVLLNDTIVKLLRVYHFAHIHAHEHIRTHPQRREQMRDLALNWKDYTFVTRCSAGLGEITEVSWSRTEGGAIVCMCLIVSPGYGRGGRDDLLDQKQ